MSLALDNNNPGNLKDPSTGAFRKFKSPEEGYTALMNDLQTKVSGASSTGLTPDSTLYEFSQKYAPSSDKNDPAQYTINLANTLKVRPDTKLSELQGRIPDFAHAIAINEDKNFVNKYKLNIASQPINQQETQPTQILPAQTPVQEEGNLGTDLQNRTEQISKSIKNATTGEINPASAVLQTLGGVAGGLGDVVTRGIESIPVVGEGVKLLEKGVGKGVQAAAGTEVGKNLVKDYQDFAEKHPEAAGNIAAGVDIASIIPVLKGVGMTKGLISKSLGKGAIGTLDVVAPEVTGKSAAQAISKQGVVKNKMSGLIKLSPDTEAKEIANVVDEYVPDFKKLNTISEKVNATRDTVYKLADKLKQDVINSGQDIIYPFKELESRLKSVDKGISIKADKTLSREFDLARDAAIDLARQSGGTISGLFDARKAFDNLVRKEFPNLYTKENARMRSAITSMRDTMNDFIELKLPKGSNFKKQLSVQSKLFKAIDNMSPKAVTELGTTRLSRFAGKHPVFTGVLKGARDAALGGVGALGAYKAYDSYKSEEK